MGTFLIADIGGGILPRLEGKNSFAGLLEAFNDKGWISSLVSTIPIYLIKCNNSNLRGAFLFARSAGKRDA